MNIGFADLIFDKSDPLARATRRWILYHCRERYSSAFNLVADRFRPLEIIGELDMQLVRNTTYQPIIGNYTDILANIEERITQITGRAGVKSVGLKGGVSPETFASAHNSTFERVKAQGSEHYLAFLEFFNHIRSYLNAVATRLKASLSERVYLTGLVDLLSLNPSAVKRGSYLVQLTARDAQSYLGLSNSTCTNVRRSLCQKGLIEVDGDTVNLAPLIMALEPQDGAQERVLQEPQMVASSATKTVGVPTSGTQKHNIKSNVFPKEKTLTVGGTADLFTDEAARELINLSPKLQAVLVEQFGLDPQTSPLSSILSEMPAVTHSFLDDGTGTFDYYRSWNTGWRRHGLKMLALLVATVEGTAKQHPGKWFWSIARGEKFDVSSNIRSIAHQRAEAQRIEQQQLDRQNAAESRQKEAQVEKDIGLKVLDCIEEIETANIVEASRFFWLTVRDMMQVRSNSGSITLSYRKFSNKVENASLEKLVKAISERLRDFNITYQVGVFSDISPIGSISRAAS